MSRSTPKGMAVSGIAIVVTLTLVAGTRISLVAGPAAGASPAPSADGSTTQPLASLPVAFIENRGQTDSLVRYYAQGAGFGFYLTPDDIRLAFTPQSSAGRADASAGHALSLQFVDANRQTVLAGERTVGSVNYLRGSDPAGWQTGLGRFSAITYRELWPGVDLRVEEQAGTLKYEFHVAPGADPAAIRLAYRGASSLTLDARGALVIGTGIGALRDAPPVSYQTIDGVRTPVESSYLLASDADQARFGFRLGPYRSDRELVIDPGIEYATLLGGASHELPGGVVTDAAGNVFVVGFTQSPDFPTTAGAFRRTGAPSNVSDVFVTKINAAGNALVYSTFIGGSNFDVGRRIAVDAAGNAYVTGQTKSSNFPTTGGAFDRTFNILDCPRCGIDNYDAFALKLNAAGSALVYSTFLGGTDIDDAHGIAVDGAGNAYVTGETVSADFPTTAGALQRTRRGQYDVFVTKLNATGSAPVYSTFLGGAAVDNGERIAVDASGRAFVMGFSSSTDFPVSAGAFDTTPNGGFDLFVTKLNAAGSGLVYSTLIGGQEMEVGGGLAIDPSGNAYVSGATASINFPTTLAAFDPLPDGSDAFALKLNPAGSALVYSTVLGGTGGDGANGIAVDGTGKAWLTGITNSTDFPLTANAAHGVFSGVADAFVGELSANGSALVYSTYIGGVNSDGGDDIAVDPANDVYVAGHTYSLDFPATVGAFDTVFNGDVSIFWGDAFIVKVAVDTNVSTPEADAPVPSAPALLSPSSASSEPQPITFQWSQATGAASYTIQIDDSSTFSAPLVRNIGGLTTSMYATTGLSTAVHFWRVRGVNVNGVAGPWSTVRSLTPQAAPPPATLSSLDTNPSSVFGGSDSSGTVVLSVGAPFGGAVVSLSSSNPAVASVPATVTVPDSGFTGTFTIATAAVTVNTAVTITATYNRTTRTAALAVTSSAGPVVGLQSLVLGQSSITGGSSLQGVVMLTAAAPSGGGVVALSSSSQATAAVPASVTVPAGSTAAVFSISATPVTASTPVTIFAGYNGTTRTATLTVDPASAPPPPPPPAQTAALTLMVSGRSGVRVTSSPAGLTVPSGSSGSASFTIGSSITLSVGSGRDAVFSGACSTQRKERSCTFTLNGAAAVTANVQ